MTSSTHGADLKGNIFRRPIWTQSLIFMVFVTEDDQTDQPSLKMSILTANTYWQCFSFDFLCTGISLKFHCWDWDLAENQAGKWDLDKIWAGKWDLYPPFRTLHSDSYAQVGTVKHPTEGLNLNASEPFLTLACSWHLRNPLPPPPPPPALRRNSTAFSPTAGTGGDQELTTSKNWQVIL